MMLSKSEVKYIQSFSQKKFRQQENLFIAEGSKIIEEALKANQVVVKKIYATQQWVEEHRDEPTAIVSVTDDELKRISQLKTPNKVLALIEIPRSGGFTLINSRIALALDGIQDPGNMGTIVRIADWFGITQIICSTDCADVYNSKVVQATMGSIFRVEVLYVHLSEWLAAQKGIQIYGAALDGNPLQSYKKIDTGILVIGNESKGIRAEVMQAVIEKIKIERVGKAESLNAAVATGIILSHLI